MLASAATLNPLAVALPPHVSRIRLQRPQSAQFSSAPPQYSLGPSLLPGGRERTAAFTAAVAAVDSSGIEEKQQATTKYYFVVANAKFMLDEEEHFKELMEERLRLFGERKMEQDFWLVIEPKFLDKFPSITKRLKRPAVALVSTNGPWITFMKLRLDRVLSESYEADSIEEALAYSPVKLEFEKPEKWVAPYQKYDYGWWEPFLPPGSEQKIEA